MKGIVTLIASSLWAVPAGAEDSAWLLGDWGGQRQALADRGLDMEFVASTDLMAIVDGGRSRGVETPANFDLVFTLDTGRAGWWNNGSLQFYLLGNTGGDPSRRAGDMQVASNLEAPDTFKLYEAYYEHRFLDDRLGIAVGLHDANADFYVTEHSGIFLNSSLGVGPELAQVGPSIFPTTSPGVRLRLNWTPNTYLLAAIYDGVAGDPNDPYGTHISFDHGDGVFVIAEAGLLGSESRYFKVGVGGWHHTANIDDLDGRPQDDNSGIYAIGETDLWRDEDGRGVGVFTQLGFADGDNNQIATYVGGGVSWTGPLPQRPRDVAGLAVAHARNGDHFRRVNVGLERAETTLEASYLITPKPWLTVQPDLQYIIDPGTDSGIDNALVLGLRLQVTL
jgi:porin